MEKQQLENIDLRFGPQEVIIEPRIIESFYEYQLMNDVYMRYLADDSQKGIQVLHEQLKRYENQFVRNHNVVRGEN